METKNRRDYNRSDFWFALSSQRDPFPLARVQRRTEDGFFLERREHLSSNDRGGERIFLALGKIAKDAQRLARTWKSEGIIRGKVKRYGGGEEGNVETFSKIIGRRVVGEWRRGPLSLPSSMSFLAHHPNLPFQYPAGSIVRSFDFFFVRKWLSSHSRKTSGRLEIEMESPGWKRVEISVAQPPPGNCRSPKIDNKFDNADESACLIIEWDKIPGYPVDIGESSTSCRRFALFRAVNSTDAALPFINDPRSSSLLNSRITRRSIARQRGKIGSSLSRFLPCLVTLLVPPFSVFADPSAFVDKFLRISEDS